MQLTINLDQMQFYAYHGVLEQERVVGNTFVVDLSLKLSKTTSLYQDELEETINYALVYEAVAQEMSKPSLLLEHVVGRIAQKLFNDFPLISGLTIQLSKQKPPFSADIKAARISLVVEREEI